VKNVPSEFLRHNDLFKAVFDENDDKMTLNKLISIEDLSELVCSTSVKKQKAVPVFGTALLLL